MKFSSANFETDSTCVAGIFSRLIHCDTAERLTAHVRETFDGPPNWLINDFKSLITQYLSYASDHKNFTFCKIIFQSVLSSVKRDVTL